MEESNATLTALKQQDEIMKNLITLLHLERERSSIWKNVATSSEKIEYQERIDSLEKSINEQYKKTRGLIENILDDDGDELLDSL